MTEPRRTSAAQCGGQRRDVAALEDSDGGRVRKVERARRRIVSRVEEEALRVVRLDDALERAVAERVGPKGRKLRRMLRV